MSGRSPAIRIAALAAILVLTLSGCAYDYLQHTDRVAYHAGDAVKANLEAETIDPANDWAYVTSGLGKNGSMGSSAEPPPAE